MRAFIRGIYLNLLYHKLKRITEVCPKAVSISHIPVCRANILKTTVANPNKLPSDINKISWNTIKISNIFETYYKAKKFYWNKLLKIN